MTLNLVASARDELGHLIRGLERGWDASANDAREVLAKNGTVDISSRVLAAMRRLRDAELIQLDATAQRYAAGISHLEHAYWWPRGRIHRPPFWLLSASPCFTGERPRGEYWNVPPSISDQPRFPARVGTWYDPVVIGYSDGYLALFKASAERGNHARLLCIVCVCPEHVLAIDAALDERHGEEYRHQVGFMTSGLCMPEGVHERREDGMVHVETDIPPAYLGVMASTTVRLNLGCGVYAGLNPISMNGVPYRMSSGGLPSEGPDALSHEAHAALFRRLCLASWSVAMWEHENIVRHCERTGPKRSLGAGRSGILPAHRTLTLEIARRGLLVKHVREAVRVAREAHGDGGHKRYHEVREHEVTSKLGRVFRRSGHFRGDPALGTVVHDTLIRGPQIDDGGDDESNT